MERSVLICYLLRWMCIGICLGCAAGCASALLLVGLENVTALRKLFPWLLWYLPLAGLGMGCVYHRWGKSIEKGHNLLLDEIHNPHTLLPFRMAPLVLLGTFITHLFGGSAGREGTAVQMGGALADVLTRCFKINKQDRQILLTAGISAGFGSVFGTPLAGTLFGLEVLAIGQTRYHALFPCLVASLVGSLIPEWLGLHHTHYDLKAIPAFSITNGLWICLAGIVFGGISQLFSRSCHLMSHYLKKQYAYPPLRPFFGGLLVILFFIVLSALYNVSVTGQWNISSLASGWANRYLGLGIPIIQSAFTTDLPLFDSIGKLFFTVLTIGSGFKGGEVTPLFYIGATSGNALAHLIPLPFSFLSALGFVAVFAGAANTPLASTLMAIELFGAPIGSFAAIACVVSYLFSGHSGIYTAQRVGVQKATPPNHDKE